MLFIIYLVTVLGSYLIQKIAINNEVRNLTRINPNLENEKAKELVYSYVNEKYKYSKFINFFPIYNIINAIKFWCNLYLRRNSIEKRIDHSTVQYTANTDYPREQQSNFKRYYKKRKLVKRIK